MSSVKLIAADGSLYSYATSGQQLIPTPRSGFEKRIAFAAAHVVVDPLCTAEPLTHPVID